MWTGRAGGRWEAHPDSSSEERVLTNRWVWYSSTIWQDCSEPGETEAQDYKVVKCWKGRVEHRGHNPYPNSHSPHNVLLEVTDSTPKVHSMSQMSTFRPHTQLHITEENVSNSFKCTLDSGKDTWCVLEFRGVRALGDHWQAPTLDSRTPQCPCLLTVTSVIHRCSRLPLSESTLNHTGDLFSLFIRLFQKVIPTLI